MSIKTIQPPAPSKRPQAIEEPIRTWAEHGHLYNYDHLVTEDEEPVDNLITEKNQRLATKPLFVNWKPGRPFMAMADVGLFYETRTPAVVPDVMLSLDVAVPDGEPMAKHRRSYFMWDYGKPPEVVMEFVSNKKGGELTRKVNLYERLGILYYVVFDPGRLLSNDLLIVYRLNDNHKYEEIFDYMFPEVGLGVMLWEGVYEEMHDTYVRWCDLDGVLIPNSEEKVDAQQAQIEAESQRANEERRRANEERRRADKERERADQFLAKLIAAGIDPNDI